MPISDNTGDKYATVWTGDVGLPQPLKAYLRANDKGYRFIKDVKLDPFIASVQRILGKR